MKFLNKLQIKYKIIFTIVAIAALSTIIVNIINYILEVRNSKQQLIYNVKLQAQLIGESCWMPMDFGYRNEATAVLEQLHTIPDIQDGLLLDTSDVLFASYHRSKNRIYKMPNQLKNAEYFIEGNYLHLKHSVESKYKKYGYIYLRSNINWENIIFRRLKISAFVFSIMLLLVVILAFLMQKSISQPIIELKHQMDLVAQSKDYSVQFPNNSKDEIGELYSGFNSMLSEINKAEIKLKSAFESLKVSELKWQFAIEGAGDGLWDWDTKKEIVFLSPRWKTMLGFSESDFEDKLINWEKLIHPDDYIRSLRELELHFKGKTEIYNNEYRLKCTDGTYKWILARGKVIERDAQNKPLRFIGTHTDITERKIAEDELRLHKEKLELLVETRTAELKKATMVAESANIAKSNFLANMSHEIRTPMNAILGYSSILMKEKSLSTKQIENLMSIYRSGHYLLALINDILDISKIEAGKISVNINVFSIQSLVGYLKSIFNLKAEENSIDFQIQVDKKIPEFLKSDEKKVKQIVTNLLSNAFKFTKEGQISVHFTLHPTENNLIRVSVKDTGVGIESEHLTKIFDPFDRGIDYVEIEGTGLGLAIARNYARLIKGEIVVESEPSKGSDFIFTFPFDDSKSDEIPIIVDHKKALSVKRNGGPIHILIVDDKATNRDILVQILQPLGFELKEAKNGLEAITIFKEWMPEIILMDLLMPELGGKEAVKSILSMKSGFEPMIIFISAALIEDSEKQELMELSAHYLSKPFRTHALIELLEKHPQVEFEYEVQNDLPKKKQFDIFEIKKEAFRVPEQLKQKIIHAGSVGYRKELISLAEELRLISNELTDYYLALIKKMMFDEIINLFESSEK